MGFPGGTSGKKPACQCRRHELWVRSLGQEDPLEEEMASHSSILFFYFLTLQYCIGFAIYQHESTTSIHVFPILNPPPSSLPITILLGHPSAPDPSIQYRASNLDWRLVSYMILYMFQCHSPKSSQPLSLPQSPKDCLENPMHRGA